MNPFWLRSTWQFSRNRTNRLCVYREAYFKELIVEASKPKPCRMETQESQWCSSSPKATTGKFPLAWRNLSFGLLTPFN